MAAKRQSSGRAERPLKRRGPQFAQRRTFTIVCEGQTEVAYFKDLVQLGVVRPDLRVVPKRAKHGSDLGQFYKSVDRSFDEEGDESWFVFDIEVTPPRLDVEKFIRTAEGEGFGVAWSNPCFEVWLIYHFEPRSRSLSTARDAEAALRKFLPQFQKGQPTGQLLHSRLEFAFRHSADVDLFHERAGRRPPMTNPSSGMAVLMRQLVGPSDA